MMFFFSFLFEAREVKSIGANLLSWFHFFWAIQIGGRGGDENLAPLLHICCTRNKVITVYLNKKFTCTSVLGERTTFHFCPISQ
jgi:hypothetical protein